MWWLVSWVLVSATRVPSLLPGGWRTPEHLFCLACDHVRRKEETLGLGLSVLEPCHPSRISELCSSQDHSVYVFVFFFFVFAREWKGVAGVEGTQQSRLSLFLDKPTILMNDIKYESGTRCSSVLLGIFCWLLFKDTMWENTCPL